ncbi:S41 family peptidase [Ideonella sp. DXS29W]|uniref:S41 family peptidase n=1 Tax=Ideonella lacteola TaxID=2984193 RepID=A0ABU9BMP9_9BURK
MEILDLHPLTQDDAGLDAHSTNRLNSARPRLVALFAATALAATLTACGGGGDGGTSPFPVPPPPPPPPASDAAQVCAPTNPYRSDALDTTRTGTLDNEKAWIHSYMNQAYLWFGEIPSVDASAAMFSNTSDVYLSLDNYFTAQLTPALTPSGKRRDQFSFTYPTKAWNDLINSGSTSGYGINWAADSWNSLPRGIRIATVEPGSPAALAGLMRGDLLVTADGASADASDSAGIDTLNAALFPSANGESHRFTFTRVDGSSITRSVTSADVTLDPVPTTLVLDNAGAKVGYIVFNDHIASSEQKLIDAITALKAAAVTDLVLDLRYNGGGYLYLASELAYMVAGSGPTAGKVFEHLQYNSKRSSETNSEDAKTPFYDTSCILDSNFECSRRQALPTLNLSRVTVIATDSTCSASEAIINGLRGVDIDVRVIGSTTCGKPYGFTAKDNCGISYFPIEFKGVNQKGYGDYADGFTPTCPVSDDFTRALGTVEEGMLSAALYNLTHNACDVAAAQASRRSILASGERATPRLLRGPWRESKIALPRR